MKFEKVEIQAFRAYDKADEGTFDFARKEDGMFADFISLYAPNGFGKTSFYDAVEYGVTKNIHRFVKKEKFNQETAKSEKNISSVDKQYILRNRYSEANLESFIKLTTKNTTEPLIRKIHIPRKGGRDFKFDEKETINKHFKEVILSQEWIDAFLKEDKPEERYETFIEYFGDKKIDEYYKKLTSLIALNNKRIESLTKELQGIQLELKFDGDKDILKKVNEKIISLNKAGEQLKEIDEKYSETEALNLANRISERSIDLDFEIKKATEHLRYLDIFFSGNEEIEGMTKYFESRGKIKQLDKQFKENSSILKKFESRQKCSNEIDSIKTQNNKLGTKKQMLEALKNDFKEYEKITQEISAKRLENDGLKKELSNLSNNLNTLRQSESENTTKQNSLQKQVSELEKTISEIPKLSEDFTNTNLKLTEFKTRLVEVETNITKSEKEISLLEIPINNLKTTIKEIGNGLYPSIADKAYSNYAKIIKKLEEIEKSITTEQKKLNEINSKIQTSESFQKEVEQFISKGSEIVNKSQASSCPLCEQQYESFSDLTSKISNNSLLSNVISGLLKERDDKNNNINQLNESLKSKRVKLVTEITKQLEENEKKRSTILNNLKKDFDSKSEFIKEIELYTKSLNDLHLKLNGKTIEAFENESKRVLEKLISELVLCIKKNIDFKKSILSESLKLDNSKDKSSKLSNEIDRLSKESVYLKVIDFFKVSYPEVTISEAVLSAEITLTANSLKANADREVKLKKEIEELNLIINKFTIEGIQKHNEIINKTKDLYIQIINSFEQVVKSKLNIELIDFTIDSFSQLLKDRKKASKEKIEKNELTIKDYKLLSQLKENVTPYLKYEKAKVKEKDIKVRIKFLKNKISIVLDKELKSVSEYLTQQIDSFFYEGLINELYRKIDPHPDYKKVIFKPDFSDAKPKLNVCVYKDIQDELIIPNLYFSTAQLNILSLSIFLAKALNAKDDKGKPLDCIFIDDPIQSMDSINILSTIDLIRSIVVNHKKQIILSTHDENFHNLLKKKMPSNLFNSKFMELETFGKVKIEL
jgi:exonuclease SbcC